MNDEMGNRRVKGFTIIEVSLVLAITGLLFVTLMGGWTTMLNTQSYRDSTRSFASQLQEVYNDVYNVNNTREELSCVASGSGIAVSAEASASDRTARGQSDCIVMGKYVHIKGGDYKIYPVIGIEPEDDLASDLPDEEILKAYKPTVYQGGDIETAQVTWSVRPYVGGEDKSNPFYRDILVVRSPASGTAHTYWDFRSNADAVASPLALIDPDDGESNQTALTICLDPQAIVATTAMGVQIAANAADGTAVRVVTNDDAGVGC